MLPSPAEYECELLEGLAQVAQSIAMYESFFGLCRRPFVASADPEYFFATPPAQAAVENLLRMIRRCEGIGVVIGPPGTGKTLVLRVLANQLSSEFSVVGLFTGRYETPRALLQGILFHLGQPYRGLDEGELRLALAEYLGKRSAAEIARQIVLLVDEAHGLPLRVLEEIRALGNLLPGQAAIPIVLAGSLLLEERLTSPKLEAFAQRITVRCYLESFSKTQTEQFVRYQIQKAGANPDPILAPQTLEAVHLATAGIPRLINQVCDHALFLAFTRGQHVLDSALIEEAWADLQQLPGPWNESPLRAKKSTVVEFGSTPNAGAAEEGPVANQPEFTAIDVDVGHSRSIHAGYGSQPAAVLEAPHDPCEKISEIEAALSTLNDPRGAPESEAISISQRDAVTDTSFAGVSAASTPDLSGEANRREGAFDSSTANGKASGSLDVVAQRGTACCWEDPFAEPFDAEIGLNHSHVWFICPEARRRQTRQEGSLFGGKDRANWRTRISLRELTRLSYADENAKADAAPAGNGDVGEICLSRPRPTLDSTGAQSPPEQIPLRPTGGAGSAGVHCAGYGTNSHVLGEMNVGGALRASSTGLGPVEGTDLESQLAAVTQACQESLPECTAACELPQHRSDSVTADQATPTPLLPSLSVESTYRFAEALVITVSGGIGGCSVEGLTTVSDSQEVMAHTGPAEKEGGGVGSGNSGPRWTLRNPSGTPAAKDRPKKTSVISLERTSYSWCKSARAETIAPEKSRNIFRLSRQTHGNDGTD